MYFRSTLHARNGCYMCTPFGHKQYVLWSFSSMSSSFFLSFSFSIFLSFFLSFFHSFIHSFFLHIYELWTWYLHASNMHLHSLKSSWTQHNSVGQLLFYFIFKRRSFVFLDSHVHYHQSTMETAPLTMSSVPFNNLLHQTGHGRKSPPTSGLMCYVITIKLL
jgi:hypothetical protein